MQTLYLNNTGDKWIVAERTSRGLDRSAMDFILVLPDGSTKKRRADYYEQFGNFATVEFRIKGLRYGGFFESFEKIDDLPVLRHYSRRYNRKQQELIQRYIENADSLSDTEMQNYAELMQDRIIDSRE